MNIVKLTEETRKNILENLLKRSPNSYKEFEGRVADIVAAVKEKGDEALFEYTARFDQVQISSDTIRVTEEEIEEAYQNVEEHREH